MILCCAISFGNVVFLAALLLWKHSIKQEDVRMNPDVAKVIKFHGRAILEKSVNTLIGLLEGISIDQKISASESEFLMRWLSDHQEFSTRHPYNELVPLLEYTVNQGVLTGEVSQDILWLCGQISSDDFFDRTTRDLQRLHAVVGGIAADGIITDDELNGLSEWLSEHSHLASCWPYDEIYSLVLAVKADGKIDDSEQKLLVSFFTEFLAVCDDNTLTSAPIFEGGNIIGLCAVCPEIEFEDSVFCFTGASARFERKELSGMVTSRGGVFSENLTKKVNYLIVGSDGNPCWSYACYGRKVEKAVEYRKSGIKMMIIHENDFHDAVQDHRS